jgi:hypothetical protein
MLNQQNQPKNQASHNRKQNVIREVKSESIELTSKEISFIMQFGNYYPGCSPEWELFR